MSGIGSGVSDIFGGIGDLFSASGYKQAAKYAKQNAGYVKLSTGIQLEQDTRKAYELTGKTEAAAGANNLSLTGSAIDVMRSNASQMSLQKNLTALQGQIDVNAWLEKAAADTAQANASTAGGIGGILGGIFSIFSDERLKDIIAKIGDVAPGIGLYRFRFKGDTETYDGVLAQEVLKARPDLVSELDGYLTVDYSGLRRKVQ